MTLRYETLCGDALADAVNAVAGLRIAVFRDFPYLYDGDMEYERTYMRTYLESEDAIVVAAFDGDNLVGASTGTPMEDHADDFGAAFRDRGMKLSEIFYCAESVLLPEYRGKGAGNVFFDRREDHARRLGRRWSTFCSVIRPADHPARPTTYRPLDAFWRKRGYEPLDGVTASFRWKDMGEAEETAKELQFWIREL